MSTIDEHLEKIAVPERAALEHVRQSVKQTVPDAEEVISYGMPAFKYKGKYLIAYEAFKDHLSIFPGAEPIELFETQLTGFTHAKGTIQFTLENPIPDKLLIAIIQSGVGRIDRSKK